MIFAIFDNFEPLNETVAPTQQLRIKTQQTSLALCGCPFLLSLLYLLPAAETGRLVLYLCVCDHVLLVLGWAGVLVCLCYFVVSMGSNVFNEGPEGLTSKQLKA